MFTGNKNWLGRVLSEIRWTTEPQTALDILPKNSGYYLFKILEH